MQIQPLSPLCGSEVTGLDLNTIGAAQMDDLRNELAQGRIPPPQTILFGSAYQLRLEYGGAKSVPIGGVATPADRMLATVKGPASETAFEIFFGRDAKRTPLLVRVPLVMGSFSMELVP